MTARQYILSLAHELVVDLFAGGGGASIANQASGRTTRLDGWLVALVVAVAATAVLTRAC